MNLVYNDIKTVVESIQELGVPYFMFGHRIEIANALMRKEKDKVQKLAKYPLIALRLPIEEEVDDDVVTYRLNIAILDFTDKRYNAQQRYDNVIEPILYPLYEKFMNALPVGGFFWESGHWPPHTKTDKLFYGTQGAEGNEAYIFNDPLDAIEIENLEIKKDRC